MDHDMDEIERSEDETEHAEQMALRARVVPLEEGEDEGDGLNVKDPLTGTHYFQCDSCGMVGDLEDMHSGGECNLCHAVNKDD